jgi:hypothetical protein
LRACPAPGDATTTEESLMTTDALPAQMRSAAMSLLAALDDQQRVLAARPFSDDAARRWIEYRPEPRPGACIAELSVTARKAAHRLLATGLSEHAYAQAMGIIALEEVLDRREGWRRGRHSGNYWVSVYGDPQDDQPWSWRFEGHHLSVTMTVADGQVSPAPVFLGANPACVSYAGRPVSRPLAPEEDLVRTLLDAMGPDGRSAAIVAGQAPEDIRSATNPRAEEAIEPLGVSSARLAPSGQAVLAQLVALYLERLPAELAAREASRAAGAELHFAWEGPLTPGGRHYYRVQGDDLLIEYDTTDDGNHAHSVLRRPRGDFGEDLLAAHYARAHPRPA